jgi:signal transduction histidine kinase
VSELPSGVTSGLGVVLNATAVVAAAFTVTFAVAGVVTGASGAAIGGAAAGLLAVAALTARLLLHRLGPQRAALLAGGALLLHAPVQAFASPFAVGALTLSLLLALAMVLPYANQRALRGFLLASLLTSIAVPLAALRAPHGQVLPPALRVVISLAGTGATAGLVLLILLQWRGHIRQLVGAEAAARAQAEHAIRLRDDFISVASHELKTPLTSLRLSLDSLMVTATSSDPICPHKLGRRLETADRVTDRLQQLIEELLNISRLTSGQVGLTLAPLDFAEVVDDVLARLGGQLADARCTVNASLCRPVEGRWDRLRLDQIVSNLVSNAIKYGAGKPVDISLTADEHEAVLVVRDQGIGIAAADQARIFRRFERAVSTRSYGGLGIGLWLVERIVVALGGSITVASEPGQGATFSVLLPRGGPPPSEAQPS